MSFACISFQLYSMKKNQNYRELYAKSIVCNDNAKCRHSQTNCDDIKKTNMKTTYSELFRMESRLQHKVGKAQRFRHGKFKG